ncbi:hypothetical protein F2Q69_00022428 [Brassica cretica]|uniref:Uncharacterized protein n=1 Tax=Brassica cretica TaxID=69181 RepID=A0A8S9PYZ3_BRACR|nr:hypothetical protein F2Q69_00022428 [Brassica cretica]
MKKKQSIDVHPVPSIDVHPVPSIDVETRDARLGACPAVPEATRTNTCYSQKILLTWNARSAKTNVPQPSTQKLSRRLILAPNRRPTPDLHRRSIYIVRHRSDENGNLYDQDGHLRNATANPPEPTTNPSDTTPEPMQVDEATEGRRLRKRKEKIPKNLKREANEKEMDGFTKRILRIPVEKPFDEGSSVSILPKVIADQLGLKIEPSSESFTFVDLSERSSGVGAVCDMNTNKLCLTLIDPDVHYDPVRVVRQQVNLVELGNDLGYIAACHCGVEYETEYSESIDTHTASSIDSNESPTTDEHYPTSLDGKHPVDHFTLPDQCYPDFAFQQPNNRGRDDYSIGSWADSGFHESFAVETVIPSSNEDPTEEYDEDYWKERAIEIAMQDDIYSSHSFNNTSPPSIDRVYSALVDTHPHPAKRSYASIDTIPGTSIDIKSAALEKEKGNIPIPSRDSDGHARAMDGRILQISREDIANILQVANGPDNMFIQQRSIPDNIPAVPVEHPKADTTEIGSNKSCRPVCQASIDKVAPTSFDRVTPMSLDKAPSPSIDRRYEFGHRAYDIYGARKFKWGHKDEYGVYRDEFGYARSVAGEMIPVTKDNIREILERASLFAESHLCLPEHANSFTPTKLAPEIYTKDEINEMVTGICGAQEKLGDELKTLVDDTYQPLDRGYNEIFRSMAEMRTEIESMQHSLEKEAMSSSSIDANKETSIYVKQQTSQIPAELESLAEKKDEWEIAYIYPRINDVYNPLSNNVDWLSTRIDLLQQDLDTICKKDPQPATLIDICTITSIDSKFAAMEDRLQTYEDMHDRFTSPIMRYLDTLSTKMMNVQRDTCKLNDQHDFQEEGSTSIYRFRRASLDGKKPTEHLPYTAAEVDQITSKLYTYIDTMEEQLEKRCDDIYFPFDVRLGGLDSQAEWLQKEVKAIQRQLASQHHVSASINRKHPKLIDIKPPASTDTHLVASIDTTFTPDDEQLIQNKLESMHEELNELSAYAYDKIGWNQFSIENILERLQNISNAIQKMNERWTRNDKATRSFIAAWSNHSLAPF